MDLSTALLSLLSLDRPLAEVSASLARHAGDRPEAPLVFITGGHVRSVLDRFIRGELDAATVEAWASLIEYREDIGFQNGEDGPEREAIHVLANPVVEGALTREAAAGLAASL
jgi:hypothetical protein